MKTPNKTRRLPPLMKPLLIAAGLVLMAGGLFVYFQRVNVHPEPVFGTDSNLLPTSDGTQNGSHTIAEAPSPGQQGGAVDNNGQPTGTTQDTTPSQWSVSTSGNVTLKQPIASQVLKAGDTIRGSATTKDVQYRLVDSSTGVIAQGSLSVVNGDFSGVLQFTARGTSGKLTVYTLDPANGSEINRIELKVGLSP